MNYTYTYSSAISKALGIEHVEHVELSDQYLDSIKRSDNYRTYGGGASGPKNGHYGCKHSEKTKKLLSELKKGKAPPNKGKPNPIQSERWKKDNPMYNLETREKMRQSKLGKESPHKIKETAEYTCKWCGKSHTVIAKKKNIKLFCSKSCAASYSNTYRYISHPPAAEQASS